MVSVFKKRVLAYIADYFVVSAIMWIIAELLYLIVFPFSAFFVYEYMIILAPIIGLAYFILLEKVRNNCWKTFIIFKGSFN